ncbi:MAG: hypothetical protein ABJM29_15975 [Rhizobiaceae bacterium]
MTIVWVLLVIAAAYILYGLVVRSPYQRQFAADLPADEVIDGYLKPREIIDDSEEAMAKRISAAFSADTERLKKGAGIDDPAFHEPHWGHTTGLLQGDLVIDSVEALPERFRVGLFAQNASYPAVCRPNFTKDPDLKFAVNRMAVKLSYPTAVPNVYAKDGEAMELDLLLAEGVMEENGSGRQFFARDAHQLDLAKTLKPPSMATLKTLSNWRNLGIFANVLKTVGQLMKPIQQPPANTSGWAGKPYFSSGPYLLGDGAMKFSLMPNQAHKVAAIDLSKDPTIPHKQAMDSWLAEGQEASFDLCVQLATPDCIAEPKLGDPPKAVMAAEYCDLAWDETKAPYVKVGQLTLKADAGLAEQFAWSPLQFNAWNTLPEMRPLGQLFRIRKHVHKAHSNTRVEHIYGEKPGAMVGKCPFAS